MEDPTDRTLPQWVSVEKVYDTAKYGINLCRGLPVLKRALRIADFAVEWSLDRSGIANRAALRPDCDSAAQAVDERLALIMTQLDKRIENLASRARIAVRNYRNKGSADAVEAKASPIYESESFEGDAAKKDTSEVEEMEALKEDSVGTEEEVEAAIEEADVCEADEDKAIENEEQEVDEDEAEVKDSDVQNIEEKESEEQETESSFEEEADVEDEQGEDADELETTADLSGADEIAMASEAIAMLDDTLKSPAASGRQPLQPLNGTPVNETPTLTRLFSPPMHTPTNMLKAAATPEPEVHYEENTPSMSTPQGESATDVDSPAFKTPALVDPMVSPMAEI